MATLLTPTAARHRARFHDLTVSAVERLTDDAVAVSFTVPEEVADEFAFEAGQHLTLRATIEGQDARRSYSICRSPQEARRLGELRGRGGAGRRRADVDLAERVGLRGGHGRVMTPMGSFVCPTDPTAARHHVAIAAGSGITPVMSLLTTVLEQEPHSRATLVFGNRRTSSIMFLEELQDLKNAYPDRFQLVNVLSREVQDVDLFSGRIDRERLERLIDVLVPAGTVDEWYLCGPFGMVQDARALLAERGADPHHVHHEVFHVDGQESPDCDGPSRWWRRAHRPRRWSRSTSTGAPR